MPITSGASTSITSGTPIPITASGIPTPITSNIHTSTTSGTSTPITSDIHTSTASDTPTPITSDIHTSTTSGTSTSTASSTSTSTASSTSTSITSGTPTTTVSTSSDNVQVDFALTPTLSEIHYPKIAYIISYKYVDETHKQNLQLLLEHLNSLKHHIPFQIAVVEQGNAPTLDASQLYTRIFVRNPEYNRGWGFNVAFREVLADFYFFGDNNILIPHDIMIDVLHQCMNYSVINPYTSTCPMNSNENIPHNIGEMQNIFQDEGIPKDYFTSGVVGISRTAMIQVSGWDEKLQNTKEEIKDFAVKLKLHFNVYEFNAPAIYLTQTEYDQRPNIYKKRQYQGLVEYIKKTAKTFGCRNKYTQNAERQKFPSVVDRVFQENAEHASQKYNQIMTELVNKNHFATAENVCKVLLDELKL